MTFLYYRYHCMHKPDEEETEDEIVEYEKTAIKFQNQFRGMMNKYQHLLMKESMVSLNRQLITKNYFHNKLSEN